MAMLTMTMDHLQSCKHGYLDMLGNVAMPVYVYRQVRAHDYEQMVVLAMLSEVGYYWMTGSPVNIIWLFVGMKVIQASSIREKICGCAIMGMVIAVHPFWCIWIPCLMTGSAMVWYSIHGCLGMVDPQFFVHLIGYEIARANVPRGTPPPGAFYSIYYPLHISMIGVIKVGI